MTGDELNKLYGAIITPDAQVQVPEAWMPAIHVALAAFRDLPTDVRAFMIITGIRDADGLMIDVGAVPHLMPPDGLTRIADIVEKAVGAIKRSVH